MWPGGIECVILSWLTNHLLSATQRDTRPTTTMPRCCTAAARSTEYTRTGSTEAFRWVTPALIPPTCLCRCLMRKPTLRTWPWEGWLQAVWKWVELQDHLWYADGSNLRLSQCFRQEILFCISRFKKKMWTPHSFYHPSENESRWQLSEDLQLSPLSAGYFWEIGRIVSITTDFISTCCTSFWILITALSSQWNLSLWYITPTDITGYLWFPLWQGGLD